MSTETLTLVDSRDRVELIDVDDALALTPSSDTVTIDDPGDVVEVSETSPDLVEVVDEGPQGPPGEDGVDGDLHHTHTQGVPATVWTVTHGLGKYPAVTIVDSSGRVVIGGVTYLSLDEVRLTFSAGFSGKAYFN